MSSINAGMDAWSAKNFLREVARMAVGHGQNVDKGSAGAGFMGMVGGVPVKLLTHHSERSDLAIAGVKDSCRALRENLVNAAKALLQGNEQQEVLDKLGYDVESGKVKAGNLTRKDALAMVKLIDSKGAKVYLEGRSEDTITHTDIESFASNVNEEFALVEKCKANVRQRLESYLSDIEDRPKRDLLLAKLDTAFLYRNGTMEVQGTATHRAPLANLVDHGEYQLQIKDTEDFEACLVDFADHAMEAKGATALLKLLQLTKQDKAGSVQSVKVASSSVDVGEQIPSKNSPESAWKRPFAVFKNLAKMYPLTTDVYPCFHTMLAHEAARTFRTSIENLTPEHVAIYLCKTWDYTCPSAFNGRVGDVVGELYKEVTHQDMSTYKTFAEIIELKRDDRGGYSCNRELLSKMLMCGGNTRTSAKLFDIGGGLFAKNLETFDAQVSGRDYKCTSTVTPKRKFASGQDKKNVANLAVTEFTIEGQDKPIFKGVRFGSTNSRGSDFTLRTRHYGQVVEQLLLANDALKAQALKDGKVKLPVCRIDMADKADLRGCAQSYTVVIDGKEITVEPQVEHFRIPTDSAAFVGEKGSKNPDGWKMMSKSDVERNNAALESLMQRVDMSGQEASSPVVRLAKQVQDYWDRLKSLHGDKDGNIRLFDGYGAEMMRMGSRLALISYLLDAPPAINCNGGRDRTGYMDVECKTLALWLEANPGKKLPPINGIGNDGLKELRAEVREKSGNQFIARQIQLNNKNMFFSQVDSSKNTTTLPDTFDRNDSEEQMAWERQDVPGGSRTNLKLSGFQYLYDELTV